MSYEVQFQHEGAEYIVRGPDIDGLLRLIQGVQGANTHPSDFTRARAAKEYAEVELARAKLQAMTGEGWVEWSGGAIPVGPDQRVVVECRDGALSTMSACYFDWGREDYIVRYRVCE